MNAVGVGPLVFASDRLAAILGIGAFLLVAGLLGWRLHRRFDSWAFTTVVIGLVAARLGHVIEFFPSFAAEPWRVFAFWQGGFSWPWAVLPVIGFTAWRLERTQWLWALAALGAGIFVWNVTFQLTTTSNRSPLPEAQFQYLDGNSATIAEATEGPVVINLWATWCPPCRREMPLLAEVAASETDVDFVFANQGEGIGQIETYLAEEDLDLGRVLLDPHQALSNHYDAIGMPVTLFVGADGRLRASHLGEISREVLMQNLSRLRAD